MKINTRRHITLALALAVIGTSGAQLNSQTTDQTTTTATQKTKEVRPARNPFKPARQQIGDPINSVGQLPPANASFGNLALRGIFIVEGAPASALLEIGDTGIRDIVRIGEIIPMPLKKSGQSSNQNYLLIVDIQPNSITVAPKERPQEIITIR
jgi:hypothetical protein